MGILTNLRLYAIMGAAIALWFVYGWGMSVITTYNNNIAKIAQLERTNVLLTSRLTSKQTVIERQRAAIDASRCKDQINKAIKDPDLLKKTDPFNPNTGG